MSVLYYPHTEQWEGPSFGDDVSLAGGYSILSASGTGSVVLPADRYEVWVSRGLEYAVHTEVVTIHSGGITSVNASLQRVVDTSGYLCADHHLHGANSDSSVTYDDRAVEAAGEGLELILNTDHDFITDMSPNISGTGMTPFVNAFPGDEVSTYIWGHFNGYPLTVYPGMPGNGAIDALTTTPSEIFEWIHNDPKSGIVQVNHPRAGWVGYFDLTNFNPQTATSNHPGYSDAFDVVEVSTGKWLVGGPLALNDWYRLLNRGKRVTGTADTDSHYVFPQPIGTPRNYTYVGTDTPSACAESAFRNAVLAGRVTFTNGPFVELWLDDQPMGSLVADLDGSVNVRVKVQAPDWMTVDTLNLVMNGAVAQTVTIPSSSNTLRLDQNYTLTVHTDSWIAAEVLGGNCDVVAGACVVPGCPGRMDPVVPASSGYPVCPYAHTNPVFVDFDNDGVFDGPGNGGLFVEPISAVRPVDAQYAYPRLHEVVTVEGRATVDSYIFEPNAKTVFLQDNSQDLPNLLSGGILFYQFPLGTPVIFQGDLVRVTGILTNANGLPRLRSGAFTVLQSNGPVPNPLEITLSQLSGTAAEAYEGMLVRVNNITDMTGTWPASGIGADLTITDATGSMTLRVDPDTNLDGSTAPIPSFDVLALVSQDDPTSPYSEGFHLLPRQRLDIVEAGSPLAFLHFPAADAITSCSAVIRWYTNHPGSSTVYYGLTVYYDHSATGPSGVAAHAVPLADLSPGTTYHFQVETDSLRFNDRTFTTAAGTVPAILSGPTVAVLSDSAVQITWTTDIPSSSLVRYGLSAAYGSTATGPSNVTAHYANLTGLQPGATYHFQVESSSGACGGGTVMSADGFFNTPPSPSSPPEVSAAGSIEPLRLNKAGTGLEVRFEYRGPGYAYHLYGAPSEAAMDAGTWSVKACDLRNNVQGTWATDGFSWAAWTLSDAALLPDMHYVVVAEAAGAEGSCGRKSDASYRVHDSDRSAPTSIGCGGWSVAADSSAPDGEIRTAKR
jgi:hypothetical protein